MAQLHSENDHLRKQVDHLTQVVAIQTQQQGELVKQRESLAPSVGSGVASAEAARLGLDAMTKRNEKYV